MIEEIEKLAARTEALQNILFSCGAEKSLEWCVEKEHRLIRHISTVAHRIVSGRLLFFIRINHSPEVIGQIILGARATDEFDREVRKVARLRGLGDNVVRAELDYREQVLKIPQ